MQKARPDPVAPDPVAQRINDNNGRTTDYQYDALYRLTDETINDPGLGNITNHYEYDPVGNRTYSIENGVHTAYSYDNNDRLLSAGGESYTYDENGSQITTSIDQRITTNSYDARNKLIMVTTTDNGSQTSQVSYQYDIDGLRSQKSDNNTLTNYVVDKNQAYAQVIHETDEQNQTQVIYTHGDDLISQDRAANISYYHYNGLGSTRSLTDSSGNITDTYLYNAYGTILDQTGTTENSYLYTGEQYDAALGNYYLRARYYDPSVGRFTSMDSFLGYENDPVSLHKYAYANLDPVNNIDPSGKFSLTSLSAASTINGILTTLSVIDTGLSLLDFATGEEELTAKKLGSVILFNLMGSGAGKVIGLFGKRFSDAYRTAGCSRNSFSFGTLVHTNDDLVPIEDIVIGDFVWATNPKTGERELKVVTHLIQGDKEYELFIISFDNGEVITTTGDHPFYVNGEWVNAKDLKSGNEALVIVENKPVRINNAEIVVRAEKVFNLTVEEFHTFHVGDAGYLVHNTNIFCTPNVTAFFPKIKFRGLVQNRGLKDLTHNEIFNAFAKTGYKPSSHAIMRLKHPRT